MASPVTITAPRDAGTAPDRQVRADAPVPSPQSPAPEPPVPKPQPPVPAQAIENLPALAPLFQKLTLLRQGKRRRVRVSHWGNSHVACDVMSGQLRKRLQQTFGDGGPGLVLLGRPWRSYWHAAVRSGADRGWRAERLWGRYSSRRPRPRDALLGLAGISVHTRRALTAWVQPRRGQPLGAATLHYLAQPGGGSLELLVDGRRVARARTAASRKQLGLMQPKLPRGARRLELRSDGKGEVRLLGLDLASGSPGLVLDMLGLNGARAAQILEWDAALMARQAARLGPDLLLLAYGTNEVDRKILTRQAFAAGYQRMLRQLRAAAPTAACLVLGPPDRGQFKRGVGYIAPPRLDWIITEQRRLAKAQGCAFWDQRAAMGGPGSNLSWLRATPPLARRDRVHLTAAGYRKLADELYAALMQGLAQHTPAGARPQ